MATKPILFNGAAGTQKTNDLSNFWAVCRIERGWSKNEGGKSWIYAAKTATALSGCQRGVEGTARAWTAGELIGRNFTAKDHADLIAAVKETREAAKTAQDAAQAAQEAATAAEGKAADAAETAGKAAKDAAQAKKDAQTAAGAAETAGAAAASASLAAGAAQAAAEEAKGAANDAKTAAESAAEAVNNIKPQIIVTIDSGAAVTCSKGSEQYQKTSAGEPLVFTVSGFGLWDIRATKGGTDSNSATVSVEAAKKHYVALSFSPVVHIYGVSWDGSSTTKLTRTDDAGLFTDPVPAVGDGAGSSPFDNCLLWSGMTQVTDGSNVLVAIPKYWVKVSHFPFKIQIADKAAPGYQVSPAHRDRGDGVGERDVVYIGRYECDASYMSRSGQAPKASTALATFRSGISNLGEEYWQADFALQLTWWFLYIVEFADWNGQTAIGQGNVSSGAKINTGGTDSMIYHTGRAAGTDGQTAVQYRGIENPWGNVRE